MATLLQRICKLEQRSGGYSPDCSSYVDDLIKLSGEVLSAAEREAFIREVQGEGGPCTHEMMIRERE